MAKYKVTGVLNRTTVKPVVWYGKVVEIDHRGPHAPRNTFVISDTPTGSGTVIYSAHLVSVNGVPIPDKMFVPGRTMQFYIKDGLTTEDFEVELIDG